MPEHVSDLNIAFISKSKLLLNASTGVETPQHTKMTIPHLKHAFDFTAWGPAEFPYIATDHSNVCVAHGMLQAHLQNTPKNPLALTSSIDCMLHL